MSFSSRQDCECSSHSHGDPIWHLPFVCLCQESRADKIHPEVQRASLILHDVQCTAPAKCKPARSVSSLQEKVDKYEEILRKESDYKLEKSSILVSLRELEVEDASTSIRWTWAGCLVAAVAESPQC